jgi:hypothetical protein
LCNIGTSVASVGCFDGVDKDSDETLEMRRLETE